MMESGERHRRWKTIVAVLLSCSLALGLTYFSWRGLTSTVKVVKSSEVKEHDVFNGKELEFESGSSSAVTTEMGINDGSVQPDSKVTGDNMVKGAAWRGSNSSLHCGRDKMKFQVMGPGSAELQLDMGNEPVPLSQVPGSCGILVKQTMLGVLLLVPYDCAVKQGNGTYVLMMRWRESAVNITCNTLPNAEANTTAEPTDVPNAVLPHNPLNLHRMKRHLRWHPMYVPCSPYHRFPLCRYTTPAPMTTTTASTTTANPSPPTISPQVLRRLLDFYPLYKRYLYGHHNPLHQHYHPHKYPRWQGASQIYQNPHILNHPINQLLEGYLALTPPAQTTTPTPTSAHCPHSRRVGHFNKFPFVPRMLFEIPKDQQNVPDHSYTSGYQGPGNPDSFWESFPLLYHSVSKDDPHLDWEHQTPN